MPREVDVLPSLALSYPLILMIKRITGAVKEAPTFAR